MVERDAVVSVKKCEGWPSGRIVISRNFDVPAKVAAWMVAQWLEVRPAILAEEMADKKNKQIGLKVVGSIDV